MDVEVKLNKLKRVVSDAQTNVAELKGQLKSCEKTLKADFGIDSFDDIEKKKRQLERKKTAAQKELDEIMEQIQVILDEQGIEL